MSTKTFKYEEKTWEEYWAEFWRIRLVGNDEAAAFKTDQVVEFCQSVLNLKKGMTVLDLGCGGGYQAVELAALGLKVHGVDISPVLIEHAVKLAKKKKVAATFAAGDMRTFSTKEPYDCVVVLGMSFGFGTDDENERTLKNIFDATKPGGKVLITGQHPYALSNHMGPEWLECNDGFLVHRGEFDPIACRLGGPWQLITPDGKVITEGDNPEADGVRCYSVPEMKKLLIQTGFTKPEFYGAWYLPPPELQWFSMEMISFAEKPLKKKNAK